MRHPIELTTEEARRFLLFKQGLWGAHRYEGKQGALDYIRSVRCVQFDPVDVCGKNAELVLHARVKNLTKTAFYELLYKDRMLVDYFDKNLCIFPVEDWPYFKRYRARCHAHERSREEIAAVRAAIAQELTQRGPLCSAELDYDEKVSWFWRDARLSRAALEQMYLCGELAIHHKKGAIRYFDLAEKCIPKEILDAPEPHPKDAEHLAWRVERRIGSVGLMWNRASDAWLTIPGMNAASRSGAFDALLGEGKLTELRVEGIGEPLYCRAAEAALIDRIRAETAPVGRCEFIAPLDNALWDRKLIRALFDFDYKWEIYTPPQKRKYAHYALPVLVGDRFVARVELARDKGSMILKNIWYEQGIRPTKALAKNIDSCVRRLERFDRS